MEITKFELAWKLMVELRKEVVASQRIRAQVIGFKITFVSAGIGLILVHPDKVPIQILVIPALAAIFFDFLINSYSFSIKRIGFYCRHYIEPILGGCSGWPKRTPLWEEFMSRTEFKQNLALIGNLGITGLAVFVAALALFETFSFLHAFAMSFLFVLFFIGDLIIYLQTRLIFEKASRNEEGR